MDPADCTTISISTIILDHESLAIVAFCEKFLHRNKFTGTLYRFSLNETSALRHIACAIGSLELVNGDRRTRQKAISEAIQSYRVSCYALRSQLDTMSVAQYIATIETTFLMGMFEVHHETL